MAPGLVETTLPYINGASKQHTDRPREVWGTPLSTRKLSPHDVVHFDSGLKPRAHRIACKPAYPIWCLYILIFSCSKFICVEDLALERSDVRNNRLIINSH